MTRAPGRNRAEPCPQWTRRCSLGVVGKDRDRCCEWMVLALLGRGVVWEQLG